MYFHNFSFNFTASFTSNRFIFEENLFIYFLIEILEVFLLMISDRNFV